MSTTFHCRLVMLLMALLAGFPYMTAQAQAQQIPPPTFTVGQKTRIWTLQAPTASSAPTEPSTFGQATRDLFEQQRLAGKQRPPPGIPGPVAEETWERYVRSFKHDIPPHFDTQLKSTP